MSVFCSTRKEGISVFQTDFMYCHNRYFMNVSAMISALIKTVYKHRCVSLTFFVPEIGSFSQREREFVRNPRKRILRGSGERRRLHSSVGSYVRGERRRLCCFTACAPRRAAAGHGPTLKDLSHAFWAPYLPTLEYLTPLLGGCGQSSRLSCG